VDSGRLAAGLTEEVDGVPHHRLLPLWLPSGEYDAVVDHAHELGRLVDRLRPAVLHAHSKYVNALVALHVGASRGIPVVYEVRGFLEETWRSRGGDPDADVYRLAAQAETACMLAADRVLTLSASMRAHIEGRGVCASHVRLAPNAVSRRFLRRGAQLSPVRSRLGLTDADVVFGVVSTLNAYEGIDTLIEAMGQVSDRPIHLVIVGDGPARDDLAWARAQSPAAGRIHLVGRVPHSQVQQWHQALDVFCVPRRATPVTTLVPPLKPLEAMASARPIVVSDLPPLRELADGGRGIVVPADAPSQWATVMSRLCDEPATRRQMGRVAREWVASERTWESVAAAQGRVYRELVGGTL
jgi:glycosyltransferase involved in cell wall biosynthesis